MTFTAIGNNMVEISDIRLEQPKAPAAPPIDLGPIAEAIKEKKIESPTVVNHVYSPPTTVNQGDSQTTIYPAYVVNQVNLQPILLSSVVLGISAIAVALIVVLM